MKSVTVLHDLLTHTARHMSDKIAARCGQDSINYGQLDHLSSQLSYSLVAAGVGLQDRVCIYLDKSIESLVAIFGILKTGAVYVPLDVGMPIGRMIGIVNDCKPKAIISVSTKADVLLDQHQLTSQCYIVFMDSQGDRVHQKKDDRVITWQDVLDFDVMHTMPTITERDPAYVLYTSGSTGVPKGVMISHQAAMVFVDWTYEEFGIVPEDVVANHAPLHFDLSIFDIYTTIKVGGTVVLIPPSVSLFPGNLVSLIVREGITVWYSVPSMLIKMILYGKMETFDFSKMRLVLFAGEVFPVKYLKKLIEFMPKATYYNLYGPTETNVCTYHKVLPDLLGEDVPIGKTCPYNTLFLRHDNTFTDITDSSGAVTEGELCVQGPNVMMKYWNNPEATKERKQDIIINGDTNVEGIYCTGDWVKLNVTGVIHYVGRIDGMIKSRGYRIELGEIESVLHRHPCVDRAAVIPIPDLESTHLIHAFIIQKKIRGEKAETLDTKEIKSFCSHHLPRYMIPAFVEFCTELPETSNGKVDKVKLKEIVKRRNESGGVSHG